jgi:hypothetical protein
MSSPIIQANFKPGFKFPRPDGALARPVLQTKQRPSMAGVEAFQVNLQESSGGWLLPKEVQAKMEETLKADFSDVRVHVGNEVAAIDAIYTGL